MTIEPSALPSGWARSTVEELGDPSPQVVTTGPFGTSMGRRDFVSQGIPVLTIGCLTQSGLDMSRVVYVTPEKAASLGRYRLKEGDLLFSRMASVGRMGTVTVAEEGGLFNYHIMRLRLRATAYESGLFVAYVRGSRMVTDYLREVNHGATRDGINTEQLLALPVPVPPREEQARILGVLDEHFTRLDAAVAGLARVEANLKRYRASVLKAAVEGYLVPTEARLAKEEGRTYEPAPAFLGRVVQERRRRWEASELAKMTGRGEIRRENGWRSKYEEPSVPDRASIHALPEGWCWATLDCLLEEIEAGKSFKCEERPPENDEVGVVKVSAVTWGVFDEEESKTCQIPDLVDERLFIKEHDFLFSRANTIQLVGAAVIAGSVRRKLMLSDKILRLRTIGDIDQWLLAVLRSPLGRRQIEKLSTGNQDSMRNIGQGRIRNICVPLPPLAEIERITAVIGDYQSVADNLERAVQQDALRVARLRQSILMAAFDGKLVDQDPKDEPASVLLDRIRRERMTPLRVKTPTRASARKIA